jgi:hypothetical protein
MHPGADHQAERIDRGMSLAARYQPSRTEAARTAAFVCFYASAVDDTRRRAASALPFRASSSPAGG